MEFSVELGVDVRRLAGDGALAEDLLDILEQYERAGTVAGPVVGMDAQTILAPRFNVQAPDPAKALEKGQRIVAQALETLGITDYRWRRLLAEPSSEHDPDLMPFRAPATAPVSGR